MAKKKGVKKTVKKKVSRSKKTVRYSKKKFNLVLKNLILFAVLFIISLILYYNVLGKEMYENLFFLLSLVLGFVALAFLIVFLVFLFMRVMKK